MASANASQGTSQTASTDGDDARRENGAGEQQTELTWRQRAAAARHRAGEFGVPLCLFALGAGLVLLVEQASEVSSALRTPALFAGLFLAGHGIAVMQQLSRPQPPPSDGNGAPREAEFEDDEPQPRRGSGSIGTAVTIILALWLAWEAISVLAAPRLLTFTSLFAAILLFSDGLRSLQSDEG